MAIALGLAGESVHCDRPGAAGGQLGVTSHAEFRAEVRQLLAAFDLDAVHERVRVTGTNHDPDVHAAMAAGGWLRRWWPAQHGGGDEDPRLFLVLMEEFARAGVPIDGWLISDM